MRIKPFEITATWLCFTRIWCSILTHNTHVIQMLRNATGIFVFFKLAGIAKAKHQLLKATATQQKAQRHSCFQLERSQNFDSFWHFLLPVSFLQSSLVSLSSIYNARSRHIASAVGATVIFVRVLFHCMNSSIINLNLEGENGKLQRGRQKYNHVTACRFSCRTIKCINPKKTLVAVIKAL